MTMRNQATMGKSQRHQEAKSLKAQWLQILALSDTEYKTVMLQMAKEIKGNNLNEKQKKVRPSKNI